MRIVFVESSLFTRIVYEYLSEDEYSVLQHELAGRPDAGKVIPGTGGLRKLRFQLPGKSKGKRGGMRVIYYWYTRKSRIHLLSIYYKGEVKDLTTQEMCILKQMVEAWKNEQT